jgi:hypothetical protein
VARAASPALQVSAEKAGDAEPLQAVAAGRRLDSRRDGGATILARYCPFWPDVNTVHGPAFISRSNGFCQANSGW